MPIAVWSEEMSCGVEYIDRQHRDLIDGLNRLFELAGSPQTYPEAVGELDGFIRHVKLHFAEEEAFMKTFAPEGLESHAVLHEILIEQLTDIARDTAEAGPTLASSFIEHGMVPWLAEHIVNVDTKIYAGDEPIPDLRKEDRRGGEDRRMAAAGLPTGPDRRGIERRADMGRRVTDRF